MYKIMEYCILICELEAQESFNWSSMLDSSQREHRCETLSSLLFIHISFSSHSFHNNVLNSFKEKVTFPFSWSKRKGPRPSLLEVLPFKETQFSFKKADRSTTSFQCVCSFSPPCSSCVHWVVPPAWSENDYTNLPPRNSQHFISSQTRSRWWVMSLYLLGCLTDSGGIIKQFQCVSKVRGKREREKKKCEEEINHSLDSWRFFLGGKKTRQLNCTEMSGLTRKTLWKYMAAIKIQVLYDERRRLNNLYL